MASTWSLKGKSKLGADNTGAWQRRSFAALKALSHSVLHLKLLAVLRRSVRGDTIVEKLQQNPL